MRLYALTDAEVNYILSLISRDEECRILSAQHPYWEQSDRIKLKLSPHKPGKKSLCQPK